MVAEFPNLSVRKYASAAEVSPTLIFNILHDDMHLKPYKYQTWHKLEAHDFAPRVKFAEWYLSQPQQTKEFLIFSDEVYLTLTQPVNKQNNRIWANSIPCTGIEVPLFDKKVLVWCGISVNRIFRPFYFEKSVNQRNYLEMLQNFFGQDCLKYQIPKIIISNKMVQLLIPPTMFKIGLSANFLEGFWTRQCGPHDPRT